MCGRFGLFHDGREVAGLFGAPVVRVPPRYNIAPTQETLIARRDGEGAVRLDAARWGLIPHWVKDPSTFKANLFNARSESAHQKPSFRDAFKARRCAVPASCFFEWRRDEETGRKQPFAIRRRDGAPLVLAGLWSRNEAFGERPTFTILTSRASPLMERLHDRQPVMLPREAIADWLDPQRTEAAELADLLEPRRDDPLEAVPISPRVNSPKHDAPDLLEPAGPPLNAEA